MESDTRDVAGVALEGEEGIWVRRLDVEEFDGVVPGGGEEALIRGDAEPIDLGVRVLYRARTYSRECFPESMVVVSVGRVPARLWALEYLSMQELALEVPNGVVIASLEMLAECNAYHTCFLVGASHLCRE